MSRTGSAARSRTGARKRHITPMRCRKRPCGMSWPTRLRRHTGAGISSRRGPSGGGLGTILRRIHTMSVRYLNLPPDALASPNKTDLDLVSAIMLWPDDEAMRAEAIETSFVALLHTTADELSRAGLMELVSLAKDATPIGRIQEAAHRRVIDGARAGLYLYETVGHVSLKQKISVKALAAKVGAFHP